MENKVIDVEGIGPVEFRTGFFTWRINLSIKPFKGIIVSLPEGVTPEQALPFLQEKSKLIRKHLAHIKEVERKQLEARSQKITLDVPRIKALLTTRLRELAQRHGFSYNRLTFRNQLTRWGSCSAKDNISLNLKIGLLPPIMIDYILLHELMHTRHKNHSPAFWNALDEYVGDARKLRKEMYQFDYLLRLFIPSKS
ncbi:M48 family metallopeptidase [bacterium]|nr:M48 family metallopeptidase [bacterium]